MEPLKRDLSAAKNMGRSPRKSIVYEPVPTAPDYSDVTALPYRPYDRKVVYGEHPDQFGLLWLPITPEAVSKSTIILVHGGCWLRAYDINHTAALATALAQAGYPVWNLEYRRADEYESAWPTSLQDLRLGVAALHQISSHHVNADNVIILGHSAGGHLALLLAAEAEELFPGEKPAVSMVGLAAIADIAHYANGDNSCQQSTPLFMGGMPDDIPDAYADANPAGKQFRVPVTLLHGDADTVVPRDQFDTLQSGNITRALESGAGHFDWIHPGTSAFKRLLQVLTQLQNSGE